MHVHISPYLWVAGCYDLSFRETSKQFPRDQVWRVIFLCGTASCLASLSVSRDCSAPVYHHHHHCCSPFGALQITQHFPLVYCRHVCLIFSVNVVLQDNTSRTSHPSSGSETEGLEADVPGQLSSMMRKASTPELETRSLILWLDTDWYWCVARFEHLDRPDHLNSSSASIPSYECTELGCPYTFGLLFCGTIVVTVHVKKPLAPRWLV